MNRFLFIILGLSGLFACQKKETPIPDYCAKGNVYTVNISQPHYPLRVKDSFKYSAAEGFHILSWYADSVNRLEIKIKKIPNVDSTIVYKKIYVASISMYQQGIAYNFNNDLDSMLTISNLKDSFRVNIKTISVYSNNYSKKDVRACNIIMTDVNP